MLNFMQLCILAAHVVKCFMKYLTFKVHVLHRQAKNVTYFEAKKFSKHWNDSNVFSAVFPWADDIETILKLKMSFTLRQIFIIVILTTRQRWSMAKARECFKSARPESCNRSCCMSSRNPLPLVSLFRPVWKLSPCPCFLGRIWVWLNTTLRVLAQLLEAAESHWAPAEPGSCGDIMGISEFPPGSEAAVKETQFSKTDVCEVWVVWAWQVLLFILKIITAFQK